MPIETKYVVMRDGKEAGVFASQQEAEAFEAVSERADKLAVVLTATINEHGLNAEAIPGVARALAAREKEVAAIFAGGVKAKGKATRGVRAQKSSKKSAPKAAAEPEAA